MGYNIFMVKWEKYMRIFMMEKKGRNVELVKKNLRQSVFIVRDGRFYREVVSFLLRKLIKEDENRNQVKENSN